MNSYYEYLLIKNDYQQLCLLCNNENIPDIIPNVSQKGGGAWSNYSSGNDTTHDMLGCYKISVYDPDSDESIKYNTINDTSKSLDLMFKDYEKNANEIVKKINPFILIKDPIDYQDIPINSAYLGVIMWMLENNYPIRTKYLYRILSHAYSEYFKVIITKEASGWFNWNERRLALISEIRLINYAINTSTNGISQIVIKEKDCKTSMYTCICNIFKKNPEKVMDKYYIHYKRIKPEYSFLKYSVEPGIDARLLHIGTIMMGYNGHKVNNNEAFAVSLDNSNKKVWKRFDAFESNYSNYLEDKYIIDLYGKEFYKTIKKKK